MIASVAVLVYLGKIFMKVLPKDSFTRLSSSKEFPPILSQISSMGLEKIPYIAKIINAFMGPDTGDSDRVKILLNMKSLVNLGSQNFNGINQFQKINSRNTYTSSEKTRGSDNPFIFLLCAMQLLQTDPEKMPKQTNPNLNSYLDTKSSHYAAYTTQTTQCMTLLLSECLTIINTHRRAAVQGTIFTNPGAILEVSAALHILAHLAKGSGSNNHSTNTENYSDEQNQEDLYNHSSAVGYIPDGVVGDVIDAQGKGFLRAILHHSCPSSLQKAYIAFLAAVLESVSDKHPQAKAAREAAGGLLKWVGDDVLRTGN